MPAQCVVYATRYAYTYVYGSKPLVLDTRERLPVMDDTCVDRACNQSGGPRHPGIP